MAYIPLTAPQEGNGLDFLANAFDDMRAARRQKSMDRAAMLKDADEKKRHTQNDFQQAFIQARAMAEKGDLAGAKVLLAPFTTELRQLQEGGAPLPGKVPPNEPAPMGPPPPPPPGPVLEAGFPDPKQEAMATMMQGPPPPVAPTPPMPGQPPPAMAQGAPPPSQSEQRARTLLRFRDPNGQEQSLDPEAGQQLAMQRKAQMLDSAFAGVIDPKIQQMYAEIRPIIMSSPEPVDPTDLFRQLKAQDAADRQLAQQKMQHEEMLRREAAKGEEWDRRFAQAEPGRNARAALAGDNRSAAVEQGAERLELSKSGEARQITKDVFANLRFREEQAKNRRFNDLANQLSKPNAALDAATAGTWVKEAQGGTGVISDSDMNVFWNRIGGGAVRTGQWVEGVLSGKIASDKRAIVTEAVKELAAQATRNLDEVKNAIKFGLENSPVREHTDQVVGTYFPDERNKIEKARAAAKRPKGKPGEKTVDDYLKLLGTQ